MKILVYSDLDPGRVWSQFDKVVAMLARDDFFSADRKLFARTGHGLYVLNPALSLRLGEDWVPIYDRLQPPEIDRHLGYRTRLEEIVTFQSFYKKDPQAAIASLRAQVEAEETRELESDPEPGLF